VASGPTLRFAHTTWNRAVVGAHRQEIRPSANIKPAVAFRFNGAAEGLTEPTDGDAPR
jgi:hypothetical protein